MPSLIKILAEDARQDTAFDDKFYQQFLYFFQLRIPIGGLNAELGGSEVIDNIFPLILNPQFISMSDPFTVQPTPTLDGGLFVEENGVVMRQLSIRGHTGWFPKPNRSLQASTFGTPDTASFETRGVQVPVALSGQRHFQFLQDRVFRIYGDLKRDPALAKDTSLIFHNVKDDEHWLCVPQNFTLERDARRPLLYVYNIEMLVVDRAGVFAVDFSEDKPLLDAIKDGIRTIRSAVDNVAATIQDVNGFINEIADVASGALGVIDDALNVVSAASDFLQAGANVIAQPLNKLAQIVTDTDQVIEDLLNSPIRAAETVAQSFRNLQNAVEKFQIHPRFLDNVVQDQLIDERRRQELTTSSSRSALDTAAANPPKSATELANQGTSNLAGDKLRAQGELGVGRNEPRFPSAQERVINQEDTLPRLAARFLGDARLWRKIAALNGLRPPFIASQKLPGTLTIGDRILIPSTEKPPQNQPLTTIFGVPPDRSAEEQFLGTDLLLEPAGARGFFDMVIDTEGGSTDFKLVKGVENLKQAIRTRVTTERGTNVLYRRLGYERLVGLGIAVVDRELAAFRLGEAVSADPRIARLNGLELKASTDDAIDVEIDAAVRGLNEQVAVTAELL